MTTTCFLFLFHGCSGTPEFAGPNSYVRNSSNANLWKCLIATWRLQNSTRSFRRFQTPRAASSEISRTTQLCNRQLQTPDLWNFGIPKLPKLQDSKTPELRAHRNFDDLRCSEYSATRTPRLPRAVKEALRQSCMHVATVAYLCNVSPNIG